MTAQPLPHQLNSEEAGKLRLAVSRLYPLLVDTSRQFERFRLYPDDLATQERRLAATVADTEIYVESEQGLGANQQAAARLAQQMLQDLRLLADTLPAALIAAGDVLAQAAAAEAEAA